MIKRCASLAAAAVMICSLSAGAAEITERRSFYIVKGSTLEELDRELYRSGPFIRETGQRHPGATEVRFDGRVTYAQSQDRCAVATVDLSLDLTMTLPKWQPSRTPDRRTTMIWRTLESDILRHERKHAEIAKLWLKKMESAIRNLRPEPTCARMEEMVNLVSARYLENHEEAQIEFDVIEGREVNLRLRRALRERMRDAGS